MIQDSIDNGRMNILFGFCIESWVIGFFVDHHKNRLYINLLPFSIIIEFKIKCSRCGGYYYYSEYDQHVEETTDYFIYDDE
jgi:hypothetical protein